MEYRVYKDHNLEIRKSIRSDVDYLKENLRPADIEELRLMGITGHKIGETILSGFESPESTCYTVEFEGRVVLMFGIVPVNDDKASAVLWMLSTDEVRKFKKRFFKLAIDYVEMFKKDYGVLFNLIHPSNKLSLKLVEKLNAVIEEGYKNPSTGEPFFLFLI